MSEKNYDEEEKDPDFPEKYAWKAFKIILIGAILYCGSAYLFVISPEI